MELQPASIKWGTLNIPYKYGFSRRKTLALSVHPDLSVIVKAPLGSSAKDIQSFVRRRGGWIKRAWRDFEQYLPKQPKRRYLSGETHRYLGRQYRLKVQQGDIDSVKCLRGYLWVTTKNKPTSERAKSLLEVWYRAHARTIFQERLLLCHQKTSREAIPLPTLQIKQMVSRWGSFSLAGRITLNLELIKVPKECIDYVIQHELCHFKVKHHSPKFWRLMQNVMPDFEDRRKKLNFYAE
ncbi:MAG: SprT family zinc-dependent metalloprotease [Proteobacteria bacterium]|nr:SprT family zinc-dependent metalloprotease [Pseudomonadota bacterium]